MFKNKTSFSPHCTALAIFCDNNITLDKKHWYITIKIVENF